MSLKVKPLATVNVNSLNTLLFGTAVKVANPFAALIVCRDVNVTTGGPLFAPTLPTKDVPSAAVRKISVSLGRGVPKVTLMLPTQLPAAGQVTVAACAIGMALSNAAL